MIGTIWLIRISGLKNAMLSDSFFHKYFCIENENAELKFSIKLLELQLNTLKNRRKTNDVQMSVMKESFLKLETEFQELIIEQEKVNSRMNRIFEVLHDVISKF